MTGKQTAEADWVNCPDGAIAGYAKQLRTRRQLISTVCASALVVFMVTGGWLISRLPNGEPHAWGGIVCADVQAQAAAYREGTLSGDLRQRIEAHLEKCDDCRARLGEGTAQLPSQSSHRHRSVVAANGIQPSGERRDRARIPQSPALGSMVSL